MFVLFLFLLFLFVVYCFAVRVFFTPVPADVTITRGATVWRRREGDTSFVYGGYSVIVTHSRTFRVRCTFDANAVLLHCRRKSTQDSRVFENIICATHRLFRIKSSERRNLTSFDRHVRH